MKAQSKNILKNLLYSFSSNFISMLITAIITFVVPNLVGVTEFGYWQIYLFYIGYTGILHLGWIDGVYLKYGGKKYSEIDKTSLFSQFYLLLFLQILLAYILKFITSSMELEKNIKYIINMISIYIPISNGRIFIQYLLQATNRIKEYAITVYVERIFSLILIFGLFYFNLNRYEYLIYADLSGRFVSFLFAAFYCRDIVCKGWREFKININEISDNIKTGSKLLIAFIASTMIIGVVRLGIVSIWDVETFGKISLTLNISNLFLVFINAVGLVVYPLLRRANESQLPQIFQTLSNILEIFLFGLLAVYFPFKILLNRYLPDYAVSVQYMALLFPICIYEGKMALLINTYFKSLNKGEKLMQINIITTGVSLISTISFAAVFQDLNLMIISILGLIIFRYALSMSYLCRLLNIKWIKNFTMEISVTTGFVLFGWFLNSKNAFLLYAFIYIIFLIAKKNILVQVFYEIKQFLK